MKQLKRITMNLNHQEIYLLLLWYLIMLQLVNCQEVISCSHANCFSCEDEVVHGCNWINGTCELSNRTEPGLNICFEIEEFDPIVTQVDASTIIKIRIRGLSLRWSDNIEVLLIPGIECIHQYLEMDSISCLIINPRVGSYFISVNVTRALYATSFVAQSGAIFIITEPLNTFPIESVINKQPFEISLFYIISGFLALVLFALVIVVIRTESSSKVKQRSRSSSSASFASRQDDTPNHRHVHLAHRVARSPNYQLSQVNNNNINQSQSTQFTGFSTTNSGRPIALSELKSVAFNGALSSEVFSKTIPVPSKQLPTPERTVSIVPRNPSIAPLSTVGLSNFFDVKAATTLPSATKVTTTPVSKAFSKSVSKTTGKHKN